ncbi:hypothetical protein NDU88_001730 [Pleurodeles waltl]|uniref:Uncharacterized protein n=1 Tax=Pleurodeles waltl TaxID=8319 RepID=A0AAV7LI96_PLEWA|nr:hypothetical protein NDU88_001730 [Pleurodeles waltl]
MYELRQVRSRTHRIRQIQNPIVGTVTPVLIPHHLAVQRDPLARWPCLLTLELQQGPGIEHDGPAPEFSVPALCATLVTDI